MRGVDGEHRLYARVLRAIPGSPLLARLTLQADAIDFERNQNIGKMQDSLQIWIEQFTKPINML